MVFEKVIFDCPHVWMMLGLGEIVERLVVCHARDALRHNARLLGHERVGAVLQILTCAITDLIKVKSVVNGVL